MPLIVICGLPGTGKTTVSGILEKHFASAGKNVRIVNEESLHIEKADGYKDSRAEKQTRAALKSAVDHSLNKKDIVILDSLNYIKGYRYELYCMSRAQGTQHCVVWVQAELEAAKKNNSGHANSFPDRLFNELQQRFEEPIGKNRWDRPLITVRDFSLDGRGVPLQEIEEAVVHGRSLTESSATLKIEQAPTNVLHELDRITREIVQHIVKAQQSAAAGQAIAVPKARTPLCLLRKIGAPELQRHRAQFMKLARSHPPESVEEIGEMFINYLNKSV